MQGTSQLGWQVDTAEVQRLVDALRNYVKKPETKQMRAAHQRIWIVITIIAGLLGGKATYEYVFYLTSSSLIALIMAVIIAVCCALLIFVVYAAKLLPDIGEGGEGMSVISLGHMTLKMPDLLIPLYAIMVLYGQEPEKIKIEEFGSGPYCGKFLRRRMVLPLGSSTLEVWIGHIYNDLIIIKGLRTDRTNVINAIRYYFYTKYNYDIINDDSCACLWPDEKKAINLEMWLCKNRDKIPEWIAQGKRIEKPQLESYYEF
jgi:hypothetical protein